jgi:hypothetical protein
LFNYFHLTETTSILLFRTEAEKTKAEEAKREEEERKRREEKERREQVKFFILFAYQSY